MSYIVKQGESISDVCLNATGTIANIDAILTANGFTDWNPVLTAGQSIIISDGLTYDYNTQKQLQVYSAVNNLTNKIINSIDTIFNTIINNWILQTAFWNDNGKWIDTAYWID